MTDINLNINLKAPANVLKVLSEFSAALAVIGAAQGLTANDHQPATSTENEPDNEPDLNEDAAADEAAAEAEEAAKKKAATAAAAKKKKAAAKKAQEEADEAEIAEAEADKGDSDDIDLDTVRAALKEYAVLEGRPAAKALLAKYDANVIVDLKEKDFAAILEDCA